MKKLKERFGEGEQEHEQGQAPLQITQGLGEDIKEDVEVAEGEETKEAPKEEKKKRKEKEQAMEKPKKTVKQSQPNLVVPLTRSSSRAATIQAIEVAKPKEKREIFIAGMSQPAKKTYRRLRKKKKKDELDEEKIESNHLSQFKVVSYNPSSNIDNLYDNIKTNRDLSSFTHVYFDKLGSIDKNKVEESIYDMMATFKTTPLEIVDSLPKSLYNIVKQKWQYSLTTERQIKEAQLAQVIPTLDKKMMEKSMNKYKGRPTPKYRAFKLLKNYIEEGVTQSTFLCKEIYGLSTKDVEKKGDEKEHEPKKDKEERGAQEIEVQDKDCEVDGIKETTKEATTKEEQQDVHDVKVLSASPPQIYQVIR